MPMWVYNPHTGGKRIPPAVRARTQRRILDYADKHYAGKFTRIDVRFRGPLCYIDAYTEPDVPPGGHPLRARPAISGSIDCKIRPCISAGFVTSETKTAGVLPGTLMPTKSTNQAC